MASSLSGNGEGSSVKHASVRVDPGTSSDEEDSLSGNDADGGLLQEDLLMEESPARSVTHIWSAGVFINQIYQVQHSSASRSFLQGCLSPTFSPHFRLQTEALLILRLFHQPEYESLGSSRLSTTRTYLCPRAMATLLGMGHLPAMPRMANHWTGMRKVLGVERDMMI